MNITKRLILGLAAVFGMTIATAGPALAGVPLNHTEPLTRR